MTSRRLLLIFAFVAILCLLLATQAFADSAAINIGDTVNGSFTSDVTKFEYTFEVPESGKLTIDIYNGVSDDIETNLSGPGWGQFNHESKPGNNTDDYEVAPGQYKLSFRSYFFNSPGDFSFSTKSTPSGETFTEENESINLIRRSAALSFKKKVKGHLAINDKDDWFKIELPSSGKLNINVHSDIDKMNLGLRDENEDVIEGATQDLGIEKGDQTISFELVKGTYYINFNELTSSSWYTTTGNYSFVPSFKSSGETYQYKNETVNLIRKKAAIPLSKTIKGHMAQNDFTDCFKVRIPKSGKYTIKLTGSADNLGLNISDKNEQYVADLYHTKGTASHTYTLKKGTYYFTFTGDYGNYSFRISPKAVTLSKVKKAEKSFKATWKKGTGDGYQIQYSTDRNFKKNVKSKSVNNVKTTSKTIKNLKSGKTYYVRVRSFVKSGDSKIYSSWCMAKSVKTL